MSNIRRDEWLYAWHRARKDRRYGKSAGAIGPLLAQAVREVQRLGSDRLALRARLAFEPQGSPRSAFLYTSRAGFLKHLNRA